MDEVTVNGRTYIIKNGTYSTIFNGKIYSDGEVYLDGERIYCKNPLILRVFKWLLFIGVIYAGFCFYLIIYSIILLMKL